MPGDEVPPPKGPGFFESFDAFAQFIGHPGAAGGGGGGGSGGPPPAGGAEEPGDDSHHVPVSRPSLRRPMALLHIVDDGRDDGEVVRMRGDTLCIGRGDADVVIPHDVLMSPRHASLERLPEGGWRLSDLGSTTGTFVRVERAKLRHERMIQVGATRMRFHEVDLTEAWLIEVSPSGDGRRHECHAPFTTIGRAGSTVALDDPFVSDIHAMVKRKAGGWSIRNLGANGLWVRITEPILLPDNAQFLCGEQRFVFEPLG